MNFKDNYLLCVRCMTYNHSEYIKDALDGFCMQRTKFPFYTVVFDDASTDGEQEVIKSYMERHFELSEGSGCKQWETEEAIFVFARHKENENCYFLVVYLKKNLYKTPRKDELIKEWCVAKYIALCEGDDYWTDPLKLQKQVDFMENHEDYALCFTNSIVRKRNREVKAINAVWDTYSIEDIISTNALNMSQRGDNVTSCGHTSTVLYRVPNEPLPAWVSKCFIGDEPRFIALGQYGKAKFLNEVTSVYREGIGVSFNNFSFEKDWRNRIEMYQIINKGLNNKYSKIINPIIKEYKLKVFKLLWKNARKRDAISFAIKAIK